MVIHSAWWSLFHELWGLNKDGVYDKSKWIKLQKMLEKLEREITESPNKEPKPPYGVVPNFKK